MNKRVKNVDVIIPNFNETTRLERALDSVLIQTPYINNIYIVDDGSQKITDEYYKKLKNSINSLVIIKEPRSGLPGRMRKKAINNSSASWIAFLDADDWWEPNKISAQLSHAANSGAEFIATNGYMVYEGTNNKNQFFELVKTKYKFNDIIHDNKIINSSVLVSRRILSDIDYYSDDWYVRAVEDYSTWLKILTKHNVSVLNANLVNYTNNDKSIRISRPIDTKIYAYIDVLRWCLERKKVQRYKLQLVIAIFKMLILEIFQKK